MPHKWAFYFLMAVGFWNFVGAGVFGFLINLPIVSYFEVGTILTPNHGHAAMMGVFGMLALSLDGLCDAAGACGCPVALPSRNTSGFRSGGSTSGLGLMVVLNLFPGGVLQLADVLQNGYWHARGPNS